MTKPHEFRNRLQKVHAIVSVAVQFGTREDWTPEQLADAVSSWGDAQWTILAMAASRDGAGPTTRAMVVADLQLRAINLAIESSVDEMIARVA